MNAMLATSYPGGPVGILGFILSVLVALPSPILLLIGIIVYAVNPVKNAGAASRFLKLTTVSTSIGLVLAAISAVAFACDRASSSDLHYLAWHSAAMILITMIAVRFRRQIS